MKKEIYATAIRIKIIEIADAVKLHSLRTNPIVTAFIERDLNQSVADVESFIRKVTSDSQQMLFFKIETLPDLEFAGTISLKNIDLKKGYAEVGYELRPEFQGQGIMAMALDKMISLAFEDMNLNLLEAFTNKQNIRSRKLLERFNFVLIENKIDPKNLENVIYGLKRLDNPGI